MNQRRKPRTAHPCLHARPVPSCPPRDVAAPLPRHRGHGIGVGSAWCAAGLRGCTWVHMGACEWVHGYTGAWVHMFVGAHVGEKRLSEFPARGASRGPAAPPSSRQTGAAAQQHFAASSVVLVPLSLCKLGVAARTHTHTHTCAHTCACPQVCAHLCSPTCAPPPHTCLCPPPPPAGLRTCRCQPGGRGISLSAPPAN